MCLSDNSQNMGRRNNGHSYNGLGRNLTPCSIWDGIGSQVEILRSTPGNHLKSPTTFAEAAMLASVKLTEREEASSIGLLLKKKPVMSPETPIESATTICRRLSLYNSCSSSDSF